VNVFRSAAAICKIVKIAKRPGWDEASSAAVISPGRHLPISQPPTNRPIARHSTMTLSADRARAGCIQLLLFCTWHTWYDIHAPKAGSACMLLESPKWLCPISPRPDVFAQSRARWEGRDGMEGASLETHTTPQSAGLHPLAGIRSPSPHLVRTDGANERQRATKRALLPVALRPLLAAGCWSSALLLTRRLNVSLCDVAQGLCDREAAHVVPITTTL
jgi:hypothetical protein